MSIPNGLRSELTRPIIWVKARSVADRELVALLVGMILVYAVVFQLIMLREDREYSLIRGVYWAVVTMTTLGYGDITFTSDAGHLFSVVVLLSGVIFLLVMLPFTFIRFFYAPWLEAHNRARTPRKLPEQTEDHVLIGTSEAEKLFSRAFKEKHAASHNRKNGQTNSRPLRGSA